MNMSRLKTFAIACCLALFAVALSPRAKADEWNKKTIITVTEPLAIPGKVLPPGTYVLRLLDSPSNRHIVQVLNQDETKVEATVFAIPDLRQTPTGKTALRLWELPAGQPRALKSWFYPGDTFGQEFARPALIPATVAQAPPPPPPAQKPAPQQPEIAKAAPPPQPTPAPAPAETAPAPQPQAPASAPLPKTASPYPLVGLLGLISLGLAGGIRAASKRLA